MTITMLVDVKKMGGEMDNRAFKPPVLTAQRIWQEAKAQYCSIEYKYKHKWRFEAKHRLSLVELDVIDKLCKPFPFLWSCHE